MEGRGDESGKLSSDVGDRKRLYSFDDLDDEPPVQPRPRRFISSSHRLQVFPVPEKRDQDSWLDQPKKTCDVNKENVTSPCVSYKVVENADKQKSEVPIKFSEANSESSQNGPSDDIISHTDNDSVSDSGQSQEGTTQKWESRQVLQVDDCHQVLYVHSQQLIDHCNQLPRIPATVCDAEKLKFIVKKVKVYIFTCIIFFKFLWLPGVTDILKN